VITLLNNRLKLSQVLMEFLFNMKFVIHWCLI